jgi:hypothetical protein
MAGRILQAREICSRIIRSNPAFIPARVLAVRIDTQMGRSREARQEACLHPKSNVRFVNTPSLWQVRRPLYRSSAERWKNYEPWLGSLAELVTMDA